MSGGVVNLAVVGTGLVSPAGITPRDHVFYLRAGVLVPPPSPFVKGDDERVDVQYCTWIGGRAPMGERLVRMSRAAVHEAWTSAGPSLDGADVPLFLCTGRPRPGLTEADRRPLVEALRAQTHAREIVDAWGAAGVFGALREARERIDAGARAVLLVAADSHIAVDAIAKDVALPPSYWAIDPQPLSEAAAALLVMEPRVAIRERLPVLATILDSRMGTGTSTDDDDEIVDGAAMTAALRTLPFDGPVHLILGQYMVDYMRRQEWVFAEARNASRFDPDYAHLTVETRVGRIGAAAGLFNLAYGISMLRHDTTERPFPPGARMLAWAISRDGVRGIAAVKGAGA
jgi:hypothetical protein